ncbi:hypothetical protein [Microcoleus anatoxicus]|uniref:Transposase n=1 Tax=Microcoleus anatoxicus PTRS2 TaxID=2705321 RepID=A0ABU8YT19_9CYAN
MDWRHLPDHKVVRLQRDGSCKLPAIALSSVSAIASLILEIRTVI